MPKRVPELRSDAEAEPFLAQDLSDLDWSQFVPLHFEPMPKGTSMTVRLPAPLLATFKEHAAAVGIPYQRLVRVLMEREIAERRDGRRSA